MKKIEETRAEVPCLGYWTHTTDCSDFGCEYEHASGFSCDDCVVNGGRFDPRTGAEVHHEEGVEEEDLEKAGQLAVQVHPMDGVRKPRA
jgi:hypothetical protein